MGNAAGPLPAMTPIFHNAAPLPARVNTMSPGSHTSLGVSFNTYTAPSLTTNITAIAAMPAVSTAIISTVALYWRESRTTAYPRTPD